MRYSIRDVPTLARSPIGRAQILRGILARCRPVLLPLAGLYRRSATRRVRIVAVVGSFGKSTTTRAVAQVLGVRLHEGFGNNVGSGIATAVLRIRPGQRHGVVEAGLDGVGQMAGQAWTIQPDIAVVTSVGSEHHRSLGTLEVTRHEKAHMVRALDDSGIAILNGDDPNVRWMASLTRARVITFGFGQDNDVRASDVRLDWPRGMRFTLHAGTETHQAAVGLIGRHMVYPGLAAVAVAYAEGLPLDRAVEALTALRPTPGRMEPVPLPGDVWILRDDHKSAPETIVAALETLAQVPARRRIVALGEVSEPVGNSRHAYRDVGQHLARAASGAVVICSGTGFRNYAAGAAKAGLARSELHYAGRKLLEGVRLLRGMLEPGDVLLVKGSGPQHMERITLALAGRNVRCDLTRCEVKIHCDRCPMMERGWHGEPRVRHAEEAGVPTLR